MTLNNSLNTSWFAAKVAELTERQIALCVDGMEDSETAVAEIRRKVIFLLQREMGGD